MSSELDFEQTGDSEISLGKRQNSLDASQNYSDDSDSQNSSSDGQNSSSDSQNSSHDSQNSSHDSQNSSHDSQNSSVKLQQVISESDDNEEIEEDSANNTDEEEKLTEARCFSPHTRRSITGKLFNRKRNDTTTEDELSLKIKARTKKRTNVISDSSDDEAIISTFNKSNSNVMEHNSTRIDDEQHSAQQEKSSEASSIISDSRDDEVHTLVSNKSEGNTVDQDFTTQEKNNGEISIQHSLQTNRDDSGEETSDDSVRHAKIPASPIQNQLLSESKLNGKSFSNIEHHSTQNSIHSFNNSVILLSDDDAKAGSSGLQGSTKSIVATNLNSVEYVTKDFYDKQELERHKIIEEIVRLNSLKAMSPQLPDNGARIIEKIGILEIQLQNKNSYIENIRIRNDSIKNEKIKPAVALKRNSWDDIEAAADAIQPKHTGKVGLHNFNAKKALTVDRLKQLHNCLDTCPVESDLADPPAALKISLMPHQLHAIKWMAWRERQRPRGGILADDMGLGKTLTVISLVASHHEQEKSESSSNDESDNDDDDDKSSWQEKNKRSTYYGGTLVVCPASLIGQWEREVEQRLKRNSMQTCVHHGAKRETKPRHLSKYDLVVTSYAIVSSEYKKNGALFGVRWERIVLDEAHIIRNHQTNQSKSCCLLKGTRKWALTGTPIQNKEADLYSLLKFLKCSPFDDLAVYKQWLCSPNGGTQQRLNTLIQTLLLRRTKQQLQNNGTLQSLPEKKIEDISVVLEMDEMNVYQKVLGFSKTLFAQFLYQRAGREYVVDSRKPNQAYDEMHKKMVQLQGAPDVKAHQILVFILRLRQICCHPGLIDAMLEDEDASHSSEESFQHLDILEQLEKLNINDENDSGVVNQERISKVMSKVLLRSNPVFDFNRPSSKFKAVLKLLEDKILQTDDKAVIVSQWSNVLEIFGQFLNERSITYTKITGQVAVKLRNDIVVNFNNKHNRTKVLLLSLNAGGVGLNLAGGNHLVIMDPHWNPQLESQAQDRVYRLGQTKPVTIYKILCKETIEERIRFLQEKKLSMAESVLTGAKRQTNNKLTIEDMKSLFGV